MKQNTRVRIIYIILLIPDDHRSADRCFDTSTLVKLPNRYAASSYFNPVVLNLGVANDLTPNEKVIIYNNIIFYTVKYILCTRVMLAQMDKKDCTPLI